MTPEELHKLATYQNTTCGLPTPEPPKPLIFRVVAK